MARAFVMKKVRGRIAGVEPARGIPRLEDRERRWLSVRRGYYFRMPTGLDP